MDDLLTIKGVATEIFHGCVSSHSVRRWIARGLGNPKVKLVAHRMGRDYFVKRQDAEEFKEAISNPDLFRQRKRSERVERAKRRLERAGA